MPVRLRPALSVRQEGTSRAGRLIRDLAPEAARLDGRSVADLVRSAQSLAGRIADVDDADAVVGSWGAFLADDAAPGALATDERIAERLERLRVALAGDEPLAAPLPPDERLQRPHFSLFLAFLHLLRHATDAVDDILDRHLEHYFGDVLRLTPQPATPDRLFLVFEPARGTAALEVPAGFTVTAGPDSLDRERLYATPAPRIVNRARVARVASVFVQRDRVDLDSVRTATHGTLDDKRLAIVRLALGSPRPGDPLPPGAPGSTSAPAAESERPPLERARFPVAPLRPRFGWRLPTPRVEFARLLPRGVAVASEQDSILDDPAEFGAWLRRVTDALAFADSELHLQHYEIRQIVAVKRRRDAAAAADWRAIDGALETAAGRRRPPLQLPGGGPANFARNLERLLDVDGFEIGNFFHVNADVPTVAYLERLATQRYRHDIRVLFGEAPSEDQRFAGVLAFFPLDAYAEMIARKQMVDNDWRVVAGYMTQAGRRYRDRRGNREAVSLDGVDPTDIEALLRAARGDDVPVPYDTVGLVQVSDLLDYHDLVVDIEDWFHLSAEHLLRLLPILDSPVDVSTSGWAWASARLREAHQRKVAIERRDDIAAIREGADDPVAGLREALGEAMGEPDARGLEPLVDRAASFLEPAEARMLASAAQAIAEGSPPAIPAREVDALIERAERRRLGAPSPEPRTESWISLYARDDATTATPADGETGWRPFGRPPLPSEPQRPDADIGWAIASPLLRLSAGERHVRVELELAEGAVPSPASEETSLPFLIQLSSAEGWFEPQAAELRFVPSASNPRGVPVLRLDATLGLEDPSPAPPPPPESFSQQAYPVIKGVLAPAFDEQQSRWELPYADLRDFRVLRVRIEVRVDPAADETGLFPLIVETDTGAVDGAKPFEPFGLQPAVGASFAIGHPDLLDKPLTQLQVRAQWMGAPDDYATHYANYDNWQVPTVRVELVDRGRAPALMAEQAAFFERRGRTESGQIDADPPANEDGTPVRPPRAAGDPAIPPTQWSRHVRITLAPHDFRHQAYPTIASRKAMELAVRLAQGDDDVDASAYAVAAPYTPKLKLLGLGFRAGGEVGPGPVGEAFFHVHPFGYETAAMDPHGGGMPLLPSYEHEGELYIGIADAAPPQSLSLLFALAEGTGDPDARVRTPEWGCLGAEGWVPLDGAATPADGTAGLIRSGIVDLALPAVTPSPRLPGGHVWLRARLGAETAAACRVVGLHTQAATAVFVDDGNAPDHYAAPLPAESVTGPVTEVAGLDGVTQPYASFGGRPVETRDVFRIRAAERLRHRRRAVTAWDYERLVLARFPEIWKVKCLPPRRVEQDTAPSGAVRLVVLPDLRLLRSDPARPSVPAHLIAEIGEYLDPLMPMSARLEVRNPSYVEVKFRVALRFRSDRDPDFDRARLETALNRWLTPWAFDDGADPVIGGRVLRSNLIAFIDSQPFVDFVAGLTVFTSTDGATFQVAPGDVVEADADDAVLIAAPRHEIDLVTSADGARETLRGIGYMRIQLDFQIAGEAGS